jgi:hypothetical protein
VQAQQQMNSKLDRGFCDALASGLSGDEQSATCTDTQSCKYLHRQKEKCIDRETNI